MLHRTKYNRFRNDSVTSFDELIHNLSMSGKGTTVTTTATTSEGPSCPTSSEVLRKDQEDGPTTLCTFIQKMSHLKFANTGSLLGIKNLSSAVKDLAVSKLQGSSSTPSSVTAAVDICNPISTTPCSQQDVNKMSTDKWAKVEDIHQGGDDWNHSGSFVNRPSRGWLHSNEKILGPGVMYVVKYLGCIEVLRSMRSLDFNTRTQITREAISRVCEAVPGTKGAFRKRKPPSKALSSVLGKSNLQFAGMNITLNISTSSLNLMTPDTKQIIANHHMQSISFASGGDPDTTDYVAYVAKDPVNRRACHILECCDGLAQDVISTIGQAFELRFKQYLQCPTKISSIHNRMPNLEESIWAGEDEEFTEHPYYNSIPGKIPPSGGFIDVRLRETHQLGLNQSLPAHCFDITQPVLAIGQDQSYYQGPDLGENHSEDRRQALGRYGSSTDVCIRPEVRPSLSKDGEVPTYVNTQHLDLQALTTLQVDLNTNTGTNELTNNSENQSKKDVFDMKPFEDALKLQTDGQFSNKPLSLPNDSPHFSKTTTETVKECLEEEPWYHGEMSRKDAEQLLTTDGDFLVRKSTTNPGSYVLTGMHNGQSKHLLLVDPEGIVRTKDHIFESISHLIYHHRDSNLPIVSAGSELCLKQSVERKQCLPETVVRF
ncbi:SHC-transforming protein 3-like isoform X1 [Chiloscyllium plagiosum]|uniref:SHC-transforming protein 3-like isoform X1 n=1 Tax=Chiloscyllium plagiosum TaxID=36176 RepID=UPI001CB85780|nr:SHC-transforming protein 3-like isoform X1 [Chiloscyllium plagiosum]